MISPPLRTAQRVNPRQLKKRWWTRAQRIRTFAEVPIEATILDTDAPPIYQQIAPKAFQLQQVGMSDSAIAKRLGITDRTVAKAIDWFRNMKRCFHDSSCGAMQYNSNEDE